MGGTEKTQAQKAKGKTREDRLKAALKANLGRRKAQARARQVEVEQKDSDDV